MVVTSRQILDELGIKNIKTLTRWYQAGVIPDPTIESRDGVGRIACWAPWVLKHCKVIKALTDEGKTLKQIAVSFGNDWDQIGRRYRTYDFQRSVDNKQEAEELYAIADAISELLGKRLLEIRLAITASRVQIAGMEISKEALDLAKAGLNPVLVISPPLQVIVVPDFVVSQYLSENYDSTEPVIVIPLFAICKSLAAAKDLPTSPATKPVARVKRGRGASARESTFRLTKKWKFKIESANPSSTKAKRTKKKR